MKTGICVFLSRNLFSSKHFLLDCTTDFSIIRSRFFNVNSLKELFDSDEPVKYFHTKKRSECIMKFILDKTSYIYGHFLLYLLSSLIENFYVDSLRMAVDRHILLHFIHFNTVHSFYLMHYKRVL